MRGVSCDGQSLRLLRDLTLPFPSRPDDRLVRVQFAGICDTDLQLARGYMGFEGILGHEFVGRLDDGRRVTSEINFPCRTCETCRSGLPQHCPHRTVMGILGRDGAMADLVIARDDTLHEIPDAIDDLSAVFIEPLAAAFRVPEQVEFGPKTRIAVLGDGKLGLLCAWVARLSSEAVYLIGKHPDKLALAGDEIETLTPDLAAPLLRSFDVVIDATGSSSGLSDALKLVTPCGTVVLKTTIAKEHMLSLAPIVIDEVRVFGSRCGPFDKAISALADRRIDVRPLIGQVFPIDDAEAAFRAAGARGAKKMILRV